MDAPRAELIERLFHEAAELPSERRDEFLRERCGSDVELCAEVQTLLRHHAEAPAAFLVGRGDDEARETAELLVGRQVSHFRVTRVIAAGGMGIVYEAQQDQPRRRVALKVLRSGLATEAALRRFAHEPEILARLHHPAIAQIYETGTHEEGALRLPYFAMEFVPGARSLTEYAAEHALNERQRLELFAQICDAVQHGHQRGIVHRDLKPGNILIDESGSPKVIDFGVARATDADVTISTLRTDPGQILGTLQYMSPEQCAGDAVEIDTRSDVYALGVVLYELLTGALPYDLATRTPFDIPGVIREQEPRRPSTVNPRLRGDLETILLKALEKDRDHRYQTVAALSQDIRHYLAGEAIEARRGSGLYMLRKSLYRHRTMAAFTLVAFLALLGFSIGMSLMYARVRMEADTAREVVQILQDILAQTDPFVSTRDPSLRGLLDAAAKRLASNSIKKPLVRAAVERTLGAAYLDLGDPASAEKLLREALNTTRATRGKDHPETAVCKSWLAVQQTAAGKAENAVRLLDAALPVLERHADTYGAELTQSYGRYAQALLNLGRYDQAEEYARRYLAHLRIAPADEYPDCATALTLLASILQECGRFAEAEPLQREAMEIDRASFGEEHIRFARDAGNLAILLKNMGQLDEAETLQRRALVSCQRLYPENSPAVGSATEKLANISSSRATAPPPGRSSNKPSKSTKPPTANRIPGSRTPA